MSDSQVWMGDRVVAGGHRAIVRSDTVNLPQLMVIHCNAAGTVTVVDQDDIVLQYTVVAGQVLPVLAKRINVTGTSLADANLIGLVA